MSLHSTSDTEVDLCANCDKPRAKHSVEYGEQLPFCSTNPNDGRRFTPKPDSTVATEDAEQTKLHRLKSFVETAKLSPFSFGYREAGVLQWGIDEIDRLRGLKAS